MQRLFESSTGHARRGLATGVLTILSVVSLAAPTRADLTVKEWTTWPIVISARDIPAERHAATEFRDLVARATGVRMEILASGNAREPAVLIGTISRLKADDLDEEAFRIKVSDRNLDLRGGGPRGTLYSVYQFLEGELGVRFLTPDHTHVPRIDGDRVLRTGETMFRPRFSWRYSYYGVNMAHPEFAARLRNNAVSDLAVLGGRSPWSLISHSINLDVPVAKLGKDHPEYFSLVNGKRRGFMNDDQFEQGGTQPCFTNPDVEKLIIDGVLRRLREQNQAGGFVSVSQNDNTDC